MSSLSHQTLTLPITKDRQTFEVLSHDGINWTTWYSRMMQTFEEEGLAAHLTLDLHEHKFNTNANTVYDMFNAGSRKNVLTALQKLKQLLTQ